jgi:DNA repair exonuclease SbcCD nuclease subunit
MKKNYSYSAGLFILIFTLSCTTLNNNKKATHFLNTNGELTSTIKIPDYKDSLKIMQITDIHISIADENEADMMKYGERMHKAYANPRKHFSRDTSETTFQYFDDILQKAKNQNVNLLLLTGDILNFPSAVSVKYVYDKLSATGIPWLYISGNHDWHYEGLPGNIDSLRNVWTKKSLLPLYCGQNPLFYSTIIHGINFIGIDNSTGEVNADQIRFLKDQLTKPEPIMIISHIPYRLNNKTNKPGMEAIKEIISSNSDKITAIFTGHEHRFSFYFKGNLCQYSTLAAFQGASFIVNVMALNEE